MEKESNKAEGEAGDCRLEPMGDAVASDITYEEARALSAPVEEPAASANERLEPKAPAAGRAEGPEEVQIETKPDTPPKTDMLPATHPETVPASASERLGPDPTTSEATSGTAPKAPRGRPRKGKETGTRWTCPQCGKNLSSGTKSHVCRPCKENVPPPVGRAATAASPSPETTIAPPQAPGSVPSAEPLPQPLPITLDDVTNFLYKEVQARRTARRERISAQMF